MYDSYALDWPVARTTYSQFTCSTGRLAISKCLMSIVSTSVNGKRDVLNVYRAYACIPVVALDITSRPLYVVTAFAARRRPSESTRGRVEPLRQRAQQRSRRRR